MYECCVSNHVQGWPKFAARQFALLPPSTDDAAVPGLAAVQYFDSESPAIVLSDGSKVSVTVKTGYPFVRSPPVFLLCVYMRLPLHPLLPRLPFLAACISCHVS